MSASVLVHCPSCHAEGNLADPALFGKAISCPVCQQVFVAPTPEGQVAEVSVPTVLVNQIDLNSAPPQEVVAEGAASPASTDAVVESVTAAPSEPTATTVSQEPMPLTGVPVPVVGVAPEPVAVSMPEPVAVAIPQTEVPSPPMAFGTAATQPNAPQAMPIAVAIAIPISPVPQTPVSWPTTPVATSAGFEPPAVTAPPIPVDAGDFLLPERAAMEGPLPAFMAPVAGPGAAEVMFAQSLPAPAARGSVKAPKTQSKTVRMVIVGSVSAILLFATVMFLMGDPMRGQKPKLKKPAEDNPIANQESGPTETMEEMLKRINASANPGNK